MSSSAHLRLTPVLFGWPDPGAAFTAVIQLGTTLAVLIYFGRDLGRILKGWARSIARGPRDTEEARMGWGVFWGTLPIVLIGFALHTRIETTFRSLYFVAGGLLLMSVAMLVSDRSSGRRDVESVSVLDGVIVGFWQCLALIPGMSRSGSTISGGRFLGLDRTAAARFSFLLGVPSITLAAFYEAFKERKSLDGAMLAPLAVATLVSFVVGYASIWWMMRFVQRRGITPFVAYRIALALVLLGLLSTGHLAPGAGMPPQP